jgi:hypothetical protein
MVESRIITSFTLATMTISFMLGAGGAMNGDLQLREMPGFSDAFHLR